MNEHQREIRKIRDVLAAERARIDQLRADVEQAEGEQEQLPRLAAQVRLGETTQSEYDECRGCRNQAVPHHGCCPGRPATRCGGLVTQPRVVDSRADAGEHCRQQGQDGRNADQSDQQAGKPDAAQSRHGDDEQRQ